jgi:hypothetical protein
MATVATGTSDVPALIFVDPNEVVTTYRICLWAAPGEGKSVVACSAPGPILVLSADRPTAYHFARAYWTGERKRDIREIRYIDVNTLYAVVNYLRDDPAGREIKTVIVDPLSHIYDHLVLTMPKRDDGDIDYQVVNQRILAFLTALRPLNVNVILVAHEKLNDGKKGDGKLYPALGGPALINKVLAEMDICAHLDRQTRVVEVNGREAEQVRYVAQLQPANGIVCKESTGTDLGAYRIADIGRWIDVANAALDEGVPWTEPQAGGWVTIAPPDDELGDEPRPAEVIEGDGESMSDEPAPAPALVAEPGPATLEEQVAKAIATIEELRNAEGSVGDLRREADKRMLAIVDPKTGRRCGPLQRARELNRDEVGLRALLAQLPPVNTSIDAGEQGALTLTGAAA